MDDRDTSIALLRTEIEDLGAENVACEEEIARLKARVGELEKALEPFAVAANIKLCGEWRDDEHFCRTDIGHLLTFGHLRAARAALSPKQEEG